jgi:hypothetical protein
LKPSTIVRSTSPTVTTTSPTVTTEAPTVDSLCNANSDPAGCVYARASSSCSGVGLVTDPYVCNTSPAESECDFLCTGVCPFGVDRSGSTLQCNTCGNTSCQDEPVDCAHSAGSGNSCTLHLINSAKCTECGSCPPDPGIRGPTPGGKEMEEKEKEEKARKGCNYYFDPSSCSQTCTALYLVSKL